MREFHYSINTLSFEAKALWNAEHTLEEVKANRQSIIEQALSEVPQEERLKWVLTQLWGTWEGRGQDSHHDVYIAFPISWLLTRTGRRRNINRALIMMGVPFTEHDGVNIAALKVK